MTKMKWLEKSVNRHVWLKGILIVLRGDTEMFRYEYRTKNNPVFISNSNTLWSHIYNI